MNKEFNHLGRQTIKDENEYLKKENTFLKNEINILLDKHEDFVKKSIKSLAWLLIAFISILIIKYNC